MENEPIIFDKAIYFHDYTNELEIEIKRINEDLEKENIIVKEIKPIDFIHEIPEHYEILFFDWGGMSMGNSLLDDFCRELIKISEDYPTRYYIMVSEMTSAAMNEMLSWMKNETKNDFFNVFLSIDDFNQYLRKYIE